MHKSAEVWVSVVTHSFLQSDKPKISKSAISSNLFFIMVKLNVYFIYLTTVATNFLVLLVFLACTEIAVA